MLSDKRSLLRALVTTLFISILFVVDPLGIRNAGEEHYENLILRLLSPYYSDEVSKEITVILIDEAYMERTQEFPVSYNNLSRLLKSISFYKPDSVFFDILQHHEHSGGFSRWTKMLNTRPYPVYMGSKPAYDSDDRLSNPDSLRHKLSQVSEFTAVSWSGHGRYYPLTVPWNSGEMETPAYAMYKHWCATSNRCAPQEAEAFTDPVIVQWGNKFDPQQTSLFPLDSQCNLSGSGNLTQSLNYLWAGLTKGISSSQEYDKATRSLCPPVTTIAASVLSSTPLGNTQIRQALENRLVLVGYDLEGGVDIVRSPIHGTIAGVYYHAMALDNLLRFGDEYWHVPGQSGIGYLSVVDLFELIVQGVVLFLVVWFRFHYIENSRNGVQAINNLRIAFIPVTVILSIIILSVLILGFILNVGVPNWYGLLFILFFDLPVFFYFIFESFKPKLNEVHTRVRADLSARIAKRKKTLKKEPL